MALGTTVISTELRRLNDAASIVDCVWLNGTLTGSSEWNGCGRRWVCLEGL